MQPADPHEAQFESLVLTSYTVLKKKHALGHLSTIEKDFALLRDRYAEAL